MKFGQGESKYLKGDDLGGRAVEVRIDTVHVEEVGQGREAESKWILYFIGKKKGMVLNVTNQKTLIQLFDQPKGDDDEDVAQHFHGKTVVLYFDTEVEFGGKKVGGLRLRGADGGRAPTPPPSDEPPMPEEPAGPVGDDDESIPF